MKMFDVTVCLSADFRRTCLFMSGNGFDQAARDGVYGDGGFNLRVRGEPGRLGSPSGLPIRVRGAALRLSEPFRGPSMPPERL